MTANSAGDAIAATPVTMETTNDPNSAIRAQLESVDQSLLYENKQAKNLISILLNQVRLSPQMGSGDPVLAATRAALNGRNVADEQYRSAYYKLKAQLIDYRLALGDLLPERLVHDVETSIQSAAFDSGENASLDEDFKEYRRRRSEQSEVTCFTTGIESIDRALGGGLHGLTFILGDKGQGKTAFLASTCIAAVREDPKCVILFESLDMPKTSIIDRLASRCVGKPVRELSRDDIEEKFLTSEQRRRIKITCRDFSGRVDENGNPLGRSGMTVHETKQKVFDLVTHTRASRAIIVIDLFQKMIVPGTIPTAEHEPYRLDMLQQLSQILDRSLGYGNHAFLVSSEMRKPDSGRRTSDITIHDMKGDGRIASDADNVLLLSTERRVNDDENIVKLSIAKGRDGVVRGDHLLRFRHRINRFDPIGSTTETAASKVSSPEPEVDPFEA